MQMTQTEMQIEQLADEISAGLQEVKKRRPIGGSYELENVVSDFTRLRLLLDSYIGARQLDQADLRKRYKGGLQNDRTGSA